VLFGSLPWLAWQGAYVIILAVVIVAEIILTLWDFIVEISVRKPFGDESLIECLDKALLNGRIDPASQS
jgi:hypothetical protein